MDASETLILAARLGKRFGDVRAVDDVSFTVRRGEVVGFLGPNGAGKTTAIRMLAGVFPPSSGRGAIAGHDVVTDALAARRRLGYFPERIALYLDMAVADYLTYVAELKEVAARARRAAVAIAVERCALGSVVRQRLGTLSKGYRQRVGLAQALLGDPDALLLDEPTAGLDPEQVSEMRALIRSLGRDRAILLSSHILADVEATCDRVVILGQGRVLAEDTPAALGERLRPVSRIRVEATGPAETIAAALRALPGVRTVRVLDAPSAVPVRLLVETLPDHDRRAEIVRAVLGAGCALLELHRETLSLEDAFLALVARPDSPR